MTVQGIASSDFTGLAELKVKAAKDAKGTAAEVAQQFEGIFLQSMLKSMRMGQHFLDDSSPLRNKDADTFQEMLDSQLASTISSNNGGIGLAAALTKPLEDAAKSPGDIKPAAPTASLIPANITNSSPSATTTRSNEEPKAGVEDFVKSIWPKAKQAASLIGLDPKILMAQAALETGWGKFITKDADGTSSNNLFNIKSGDNKEFDSVHVKTTEYIADTPISVKASFRKYPSVEQSFSDYISLIKTDGRYQGALASTANPENYVNELSKAGYATDPEYSNKILSIYHGNELNNAIDRIEQV